MEENNQNNIDVDSAAEALAAREKEIAARELRLLAGEELLKRGLSREVESLLDYTDREKCLSSLNTVQHLIQQEAVKLSDQRLGKYALPGGAAAIDSESLSDREYYAITMNHLH